MRGNGRLEVITGPMYSGKTEELIRRLRREMIAKRAVTIYKPDIDDRYGDDYGVQNIISHNGSTLEAWTAKTDICDARELFPPYDTNDVIGFDETQFFSNDIVGIIEEIVYQGWHVYVAGLDMTYRREPFGPMPTLMSIADSVTKLTAICNECGEDAMFTQRLIDGEPAPFAGETVQVGGLDTYEARCRGCFLSA